MIYWAIGIIIVIVTYVISGILRPVRFSKPGGAYSVGTVEMEITDDSTV